MGRPKISADKRRTEFLNTRFSPAELDLIELAASLSKESPATWSRQTLVEKAEAVEGALDYSWALLEPAEWANGPGRRVFEHRRGKKLTARELKVFVGMAERGETVHRLSVEKAIERKLPVSGVAVALYNIKLSKKWKLTMDREVVCPPATK